MASIKRIRASDGTGSASAATVTASRSPGATTLQVNTVDNIPAYFSGAMGTPHTFTDPVTSETITVISEATCVEFQGHVSSTNLEIDSIDSGFTDLGSSVGDVVIIKPTTGWANNVADILDVSHDDDGTLKTGAVTTAKIADDAVTAAKLDWASTGANGGIWWEELGRTTLGSAGDTITVSSLPARKYLEVFIYAYPTGGTISLALTFNGDTGSNYAIRASTNGGADSTAASQSLLGLETATANADFFTKLFITNVTTHEKFILAETIGVGSGAVNVPSRREMEAKWANTAAQISSITVTNAGTGDYAIGSEVVVLGHN